MSPKQYFDRFLSILKKKFIILLNLFKKKIVLYCHFDCNLFERVFCFALRLMYLLVTTIKLEFTKYIIFNAKLQSEGKRSKQVSKINVINQS